MSNVTVRGTDGKTPQYDPNGLFHRWHWNEVYFGQEALNKYVAKVGDLIEKTDVRKVFLVTALSNDLIPTYVDYNSEAEEASNMVLIGEGAQPVTKIAFLDTHKVPYELNLESRHHIYGSANTYARIFKGSDISSSGKVVSAVFSGSNYLDDKVPLELVSMEDHTNIAVKTVPTVNTRENMLDGELISLVIYNAQNSVTSVTRFIVLRSGFIRPVNASQKHIIAIAMESAFLSGMDPYVIDYPLNVPLGTLNMTGVLRYSDGSERRMPVDGTKFTLFGIEKFVATRPGQKIPLMLVYRLDTGEAAYTNLSQDGKTIPVEYTLATTHENGLYSPILFGYPRWNSTTNKYQMQWWLMDLRRDVIFEATNAVQYNESSDVFDGGLFNGIQALSVSVRLSNVSQSLPDWLHVQTLYVKLFDPTLNVNAQPKFEVSQENVLGSFYGTDLTARTNTINQNDFEINIGNNIPTLNEWIERLYYKAKPVYSLYRESEAPRPTHFTIMNDTGNPQTFPIAMWDKAFHVFTNLQGKSNLVIRWDRWLNEGAAGALQLAVTEVPLEFIS